MSVLTDVAARFQVIETLVTTPGPAVVQQIVQANPARIGLLIGSQFGGIALLRTTGAKGQGNGLPLKDAEWLYFDVQKYGPLVQAEWWEVSGVGPGTLYVAEVIDNQG